MSDTTITILGLGNLLWADEGFGVRAAETLFARYALPDHVDVIDGGTQGLLLLPWIEQADSLILFDAIDFGLPPGTLHLCRDGAVPAYLTAKKMSLHQTGFSEVLALAELQGRLPRRIVLIGVQPVELEDFGGSLTAPVRAQIDPAIDAALGVLADWGVALAPRQDGARLNHASLALGDYETGRPSAASACRIGDARVLGDG
ncbi:MAG: HyaD/HybD family hydrogenase maturation endopeptidase [Paludibacterium sp.]|uniref:HyaD/HybD family hydrogenase maturation endopeptidase n=1 Tax=Paludibacterium sp. TaxID=1917523 RepID=UPI0025FD5BA1|nr:HyaD/HybD family hydrogenase maturation endopeptidase [Paludibacterium sp.]MBV8047917.1 HyaD/HybD family hydrogenase maturation endopeptidase [Paludibacterium sp.]MBV8647669.1 HyaD/HybD family hydrogenase maturation endopeptidase [Paludibacterium sp.]